MVLLLGAIRAHSGVRRVPRAAPEDSGPSYPESECAMPVDPEPAAPVLVPFPHRRKLAFLFGAVLMATLFFVAKQLFGMH